MCHNLFLSRKKFSQTTNKRKSFKISPRRLTAFLCNVLSSGVCSNEPKKKKSKESSWCQEQDCKWQRFVENMMLGRHYWFDPNGVYSGVKHYFFDRRGHRSAIMAEREQVSLMLCVDLNFSWIICMIYTRLNHCDRSFSMWLFKLGKSVE